MSSANIETVSTAGDKAKLVLVGLLVVAAVAGFYTLAPQGVIAQWLALVARVASEAEHHRLLKEMSLYQLRKARELTQTKIAEDLHIGQGDVSKLERRTDMYVSTLASDLQAVGAELEIRAVFPDGSAVKIAQFSE